MLWLGLAAVTFLGQVADALIDKAQKDGLCALEWSYLQIPAGADEEAARVCQKAKEAGIVSVSYRTDFSVCKQEAAEFLSVLETAEALGTDTVVLEVKLNLTEAEISEAIICFANKTKALAKMAAEKNMKICLAYRQEVVFDDYIRVKQLMETVDSENVFLNWQPKLTSSLIYNIYELKMLLKYVQNVYIACAKPEVLIESKDEWQQYMMVLTDKEGRALLFKENESGTLNAACALVKNWVTENYAG